MESSSRSRGAAPSSIRREGGFSSSAHRSPSLNTSSAMSNFQAHRLKESSSLSPKISLQVSEYKHRAAKADEEFQRMQDLLKGIGTFETCDSSNSNLAGTDSAQKFNNISVQNLSAADVRAEPQGSADDEAHANENGWRDFLFADDSDATYEQSSPHMVVSKESTSLNDINKRPSSMSTVVVRGRDRNQDQKFASVRSPPRSRSPQRHRAAVQSGHTHQARGKEAEFASNASFKASEGEVDDVLSRARAVLALKGGHMPPGTESSSSASDSAIDAFPERSGSALGTGTAPVALSAPGLEEMAGPMPSPARTRPALVVGPVGLASRASAFGASGSKSSATGQRGLVKANELRSLSREGELAVAWSRAELQRFQDACRRSIAQHMPSQFNSLEIQLAKQQKRLDVCAQLLIQLPARLRRSKDVHKKLVSDHAAQRAELLAVEKSKNALEVVVELKNTQVQELRAELAKAHSNALSLRGDVASSQRRAEELQTLLAKQQTEAKHQQTLFLAAKQKWEEMQSQSAQTTQARALEGEAALAQARNSLETALRASEAKDRRLEGVERERNEARQASERAAREAQEQLDSASREAVRLRACVTALEDEKAARARADTEAQAVRELQQREKEAQIAAGKHSVALQDEPPSAKLCRVLRARLADEEARSESLASKLDELRAADAQKSKQMEVLQGEQEELARAVAAGIGRGPSARRGDAAERDAAPRVDPGRESANATNAALRKMRAELAKLKGERDTALAQAAELKTTGAKQLTLIQLLTAEANQFKAKEREHDTEKQHVQLLHNKLLSQRKAYATALAEHKSVRSHLSKLRALLPVPGLFEASHEEGAPLAEWVASLAGQVAAQLQAAPAKRSGAGDAEAQRVADESRALLATERLGFQRELGAAQVHSARLKLELAEARKSRGVGPEDAVLLSDNLSRAYDAQLGVERRLVGSLRAQLEALTQQRQHDMEALEKQVAQAREERDSERAALATISQRAHASKQAQEKRVAQLQERLGAQQKKAAQARSDVEAGAKELMELKLASQADRFANTQLKEDVKQSAAALSKAHEALAGAHAQHAALEADLTRQAGERRELAGKLLAAEAQAESAAVRAQQAEASHAELLTRLEHAEAKAQEWQHKLAAWRAQMLGEDRMLEDARAAASLECARLQDQLALEKARVQSAEQALEAAKREKASMRDELDVTGAQMRSLRLLLSELEQKLAHGGGPGGMTQVGGPARVAELGGSQTEILGALAGNPASASAAPVTRSPLAPSASPGPRGGGSEASEGRMSAQTEALAREFDAMTDRQRRRDSVIQRLSRQLGALEGANRAYASDVGYLSRVVSESHVADPSDPDASLLDLDESLPVHHANASFATTARDAGVRAARAGVAGESGPVLSVEELAEPRGDDELSTSPRDLNHQLYAHSPAASPTNWPSDGLRAAIDLDFSVLIVAGAVC